jgi:hypothetical protein
MDILGKWLATLWGVLPFYSLMSGFGVYGIESTIRTIWLMPEWYCQGVVPGDMQLHNLRDLMLGQKSLGTESLQAFRQACQDKNLNITILPSAPGNQKTNPAERMADHSAPHGQHVPAAGEPHQAAMVGSIVCSSGHG